jgi:hypothetical protein
MCDGDNDCTKCQHLDDSDKYKTLAQRLATLLDDFIPPADCFGCMGGRDSVECNAPECENVGFLEYQQPIMEVLADARDAGLLPSSA